MRKIEKSDLTTPTALAIEAVSLALTIWEIKRRSRAKGIEKDEVEPGDYPISETIDDRTTVFVYKGEGVKVGIHDTEEGLIGVGADPDEKGALVPRLDSLPSNLHLTRLVSVLKDYLAQEKKKSKQ